MIFAFDQMVLSLRNKNIEKTDYLGGEKASMFIAQWIVNLAMAYAAVGFLFAVVFVIYGVGKIDPAAKDSTVGFRFLILFGSAALWPLLLKRWLGGQIHTPIENNDHRIRARRGIV